MTIGGLSGSLLSHDAVVAFCSVLRGSTDSAACERMRQRLRLWHLPLRSLLGPASSARLVFDRLGSPLAEALGYRVVPASAHGRTFVASLDSGGTIAAVLVTIPWGENPSAAWRDTVHGGIGRGARWGFCLNGPALRIVDAERPYSRRFAEFDLPATLDDPVAFGVFWTLLRADGMPRETSSLDGAVAHSERHRAEVRSSLQRGVQAALAHLIQAFLAASRRRSARAAAFDESLVIVYRLLFLLFAEARGLVPRWHPVYRDAYTIEALRGPVERLGRPQGVWEAIQAIARLAHRGCRAGTLRVTAFNGRLFSPAHAPYADALTLDDGRVSRALLALTTRPAPDGRERIAYTDLGVEQLGGVYERLLDYRVDADACGTEDAAIAGATRPAVVERSQASRKTTIRKATGTFYTPRSLTEYLVRRTLAPLADQAAPDAILGLRVLDPSMGSGAFLVAACRYLAAAYEQALIREGTLTAPDVDDRDRAGFRRLVAQRCLFGVDLNPMAVQLGRLSLWLATLAADRPLTFLDHHLRTGNSLLGASPQDVARQPPPLRRGRVRAAALPLFAYEALADAMQPVIRRRLAIATEPGDTLEQVRAKERSLSELARDDGPIGRWRAAADVWCGAWFAETPGSAAAFTALVDSLLHGTAVLPTRLVEPLHAAARRAADEHRFFHWTLEFPEVFHGPDGGPLAEAGFDAVVGNPPWEMLRADHRGASLSARATGFARASGMYPLQGTGHANLYQLFVERSLSLLKPGGRLGLILPAGFAIDHGCAALRRHVLDRTCIDTFVTLENRDGIFPVHRALRFLLITLTRGGITTAVPCRAGLRSTRALDGLADLGRDPGAVPVSRALLDRFSGDQLAIPDIRSGEDLELVSKLAFTWAPLGEPEGWGIGFGRELNATDDRPHFIRGDAGLPIVEGKDVEPFSVTLSRPRFRIPERAAAALLDPARTFGRSRLGYREVAGAANRLTLIAAIIPARVVTTHTIFCIKEALDDGAQQFLCGMLNSFVANYLVRMRVSTHVTAAIMDRLPMPKPPAGSPALRRISALCRSLQRRCDPGVHARLQAGAAQVYGLNEREFAHVLAAFPLVPQQERAAALSAFRYIVT